MEGNIRKLMTWNNWGIFIRTSLFKMPSKNINSLNHEPLSIQTLNRYSSLFSICTKLGSITDLNVNIRCPFRRPTNNGTSHGQVNWMCAVTSPKGSTGLWQWGICDSVWILVKCFGYCLYTFKCSENWSFIHGMNDTGENSGAFCIEEYSHGTFC